MYTTKRIVICNKIVICYVGSCYILYAAMYLYDINSFMPTHSNKQTPVVSTDVQMQESAVLG